MYEEPRFPPEGWVPFVAGLVWISLGAREGFGSWLWSLPPGVLLLGSGASLLLYAGDRRIAQFAALGGVAGVLFALPGIAGFGLGPALALGLLSAASFVAAGSVSSRYESPVEGVPEPVRGVSLSSKVAIDEALLATMQFSIPTPSARRVDRVVRETRDATELFRDRGWLEKPVEYHLAPPPLDAPELRPRRVRGIDYEHLRFGSGYEPHAEEPGRERWLGYAANRTAHAWIVRRAPDRPWLVCIHGYQMGSPLVDLGAFDPRVFCDRLGLNLALPVLPLHGRRKTGRRSGDGFLAGDVLDTIHAEAQAMWDVRRLLAWIREQGAPAVGVYGLSLGGYNAALLAALDGGLACAIPGIPATDFARLMWQHGTPANLERYGEMGVTVETAALPMRVVSPLALEPKVPLERRALFGGVADRLVPPDQVRDLWEHWGRPRMHWYQGAHVTFMLDPRVRELVQGTLREAGLAR